MAMIFKIRVLSDESDAFVREYEIAADTDLRGLHEMLCADLGFDADGFVSFFASDGQWNRLREFTSFDMGDGDAPSVMDGVLVGALAAAGTKRLVYEFDPLAMRALYMEIVDMKPAAGGVEYPSVVLSRGTLRQEDGDEGEGGAFEEMMADFDGFEGDDGDDWSDEF